MKNPLNKADFLTVRDLAGETLVVPGPPEICLKTLADECKAAGFDLEYRIVSNTSEAIYLSDQTDLLFCDIEWNNFNIRKCQKELQDSHADLVFHFVYKENSSNYNVQLLVNYLMRQIGSH